MLDSYPTHTFQKPKPYPLLEMTLYINEIFSINYHKIVEQGQANSQPKETVDSQGQTITELKAKVAKLVGPLQPACPPQPNKCCKLLQELLHQPQPQPQARAKGL